MDLRLSRWLSASVRCGLALAVALTSIWAAPAWSAENEAYKRAGDFAVYLGILPAAMVRGHPTAHPEREMHGGAPAGRHDFHIVIAVFDAQSGTRIGDAKVSATVSGLGHVGITRLDLDPMSIADTVTYGGYVNLPTDNRYTIALEIKRPHGNPPAQVEFSYQHRQRE